MVTEKTMQSIRIASGHPTWNKEGEPTHLIQMKIYQGNTYRKDLRQLYFHDDLKAQDRC